MGKNKKALSASENVEEINMSPLIDMVFILLIFFIVTTVFVEEPGVDVVKPFAYNAEDLAKNCIMIAVTSGDNVFYGGEEVGLNYVFDVYGILDTVASILDNDVSFHLTVFVEFDDSAVFQVEHDIDTPEFNVLLQLFFEFI